MSRADDLAAIERGLLAVRGLNNAPITANKVLTEQDTGVVLVDASAGAVLIVLPAANNPMDIRVQRVDNSGNSLTVRAAGGESIKFHTHLRPAGYGHFVLMGAGDFWHLRSDGAGAWVPLDRLDGSALGRPVFDTSTAVSPGGWGFPNGSLLARSDWPWLWDYAQQSGLLVAEATRAGMEGAWSSGDGASTFRIPELRGEFMRVLDDGRGVDPGRIAGSRQKGSLVQGDNSSGDNIVTASNVLEQKALLGLDNAPYTEYAGATVKYTGSMAMSALTDADLLNHGGITRPRNLAYPARIKLI